MIVISLGGSMIVPDKVDYKFLLDFRRVVERIAKKHKIVVVCGGGSTFRKYLKVLKKIKMSEWAYDLIGIETTRLNARVVAGVFHKTTELPERLRDIKKGLKKRNIIVAGSIGYKDGMTSDGNAAQIAGYIKADLLVNVTDVDGLYDKNPKTSKNAKLVQYISFENFYKIARKIGFKSGQHFVLDSVAAKIIKDAKIKTVIINGHKLKNLEDFLNGKHFRGTLVYG